MTSESTETAGADRRTFLKTATAAAAVPAAAALVGGIADTAAAADRHARVRPAGLRAGALHSGRTALNADGYYVGQIKGNLYRITDAYYQAMFPAAAAAPVVTKYTSLLGAADVFTFDNATALIESLRIDFGELGPFGIRP